MEFGDKIETLLSNISQIKIEAVEATAETRLLSSRLNGTIEKMNTHLNEADIRQRSLDNISRMLVIQIITFAFFLGGIVWMVNHNSNEVARLSNHCELMQKHIIKDEARWDIFKIPEVYGRE